MDVDDIFTRDDHVAEMVEDLFAYANGTIARTRATNLEQHLGECAACRLELVHIERDELILSIDGTVLQIIRRVNKFKKSVTCWVDRILSGPGTLVVPPPATAPTRGRQSQTGERHTRRESAFLERIDTRITIDFIPAEHALTVTGGYRDIVLTDSDGNALPRRQADGQATFVID